MAQPDPTPETDRLQEDATEQDVEARVARHLNDWEQQSSRTRSDFQTLAREVIAIARAATPQAQPSFQDRGEAARHAQGIDGTAGDAQDIRHRYVRDEQTDGCLLCGLAETYRNHIDRLLDCGLCYEEQGEEVPHPDCPVHGTGTEAERVVAYRSPLPGALSLYCTRHTDDLGAYTPLTSDDLPDGGLCVQCGTDVLIPQQGADQ